MKLTLRLILCLVLLCAAVSMAAFTLADLTKGKTASETLLLGPWQGSVAVFEHRNMELPLHVTEIPLASLRAVDRALIERGLPVDSPEDLQTLLEDLGS